MESGSEPRNHTADGVPLRDDIEEPELLVRRSIWDLEQQDPWHPITLAYARAVGKLQTRAASDATSWTYQAAIHGTVATGQRGWNQCQHGSWFFLPWHRLYLYYFERIIRSVVLADGGPSDWALPYWNYDSGGLSNRLPPPFRQPALPDGSPNPLFVAARNPAYNAGAGLPAQVTSAARAMATDNYLPPPFPGYGGGQTAGARHFFNAYGALEQTPHNDVHVQIGGLMSDPNTAALDPIFWLHHCNIDRLWMEWNSMGNGNPTAAGWADQRFELFDESGQRAVHPLVDTNDPIGALGYRYDTVTAPAAAVRLEAMVGSEKPPPEPDMIGATDGEVRLEGGTRSVDVPIDSRAAGGLERLGPESGRLYLSLEHVDADTTPQQSYAVYVQAPDGVRHHVGNLALFGIEKLHDERDGPHHHRYMYDVTEIAEELDIPAADLKVVFEELRPEGAPEAISEPEAVPIRVGRITLRRA
jgi:hypothetical protein